MSKQNDEVTKLRERLIESERQYINLADTLAAGSLSPEHLLTIAHATRQQRDEAIEYISSIERGLTKRVPDFACRCGQCVPFAINRSLCEFTRLPMPQSR
jgi:hypothetical protein